jgi:hypothetical protein
LEECRSKSSENKNLGKVARQVAYGTQSDLVRNVIRSGQSFDEVEGEGAHMERVGDLDGTDSRISNGLEQGKVNAGQGGLSSSIPEFETSILL